MRYLLLMTATLAFLPGSALADNKQIRNGPPPHWVHRSDLLAVPANASGPVFIRRQDALIHLDERGQEQYAGYRIRILHPSALELGNLSLTWNPAAGGPTVHGITIYRGGEVIDVLKSASFEILRRENQLEAAKLDGLLTAALRISDLRVGDELEVDYTLRVTDPTLGGDDTGILILGPTPAPGRYRLGLSWEEGRKPHLKISPDLMSFAQDRARELDIKLDNPAVLAPPKDAPARFRWQRTVEYSDYADWESVSRRLAPLFARAASLPVGSDLKQEARKIAASNPGKLARAGAALKLVQQHIRYVFVGLDRGSLTPATAEETWRMRYGDCKAKTVLLLSLLGELGIDAEPVLVNSSGNDDGWNERLPSPRLFDHVLVRATIDGTSYWLDGTMPPVAVPSPAPLLPSRWVLPLRPKGSSLERIEWKPASRPDELHLVDIDARTGFDQPARVVSTSIIRGLAGLQQDVQLAGLSADQLSNALKQNLVGGTWETVEEVKWAYDEKAQASVLTIKGSWKLDWDDNGDGARSLALPGGGFSPPERRGRSPDQDQDLPYATRLELGEPEYSCHVTTVRLPIPTRSRQWSSKAGFDTHMFGRNYYRAFSLRDGAIRMIRGSRIELEEIDAVTARRDNDRIAAFDNSMGHIFFEPLGAEDPIADLADVPATDEIDWTADNVPCLSPAMRNGPAQTPRQKPARAN